MESAGSVEDTRELNELGSELLPLKQCDIFGFFIAI
jgi:hypothetical protein